MNDFVFFLTREVQKEIYFHVKKRNGNYVGDGAVTRGGEHFAVGKHIKSTRVHLNLPQCSISNISQ